MFSLIPSELWWQGKATASLQHDGEITSHHGRYFGHLMVSARGVGGEMSALQPIGVNDMHIAAHARSEGLVLVTNNMGEFARVPALEAENWVHAGQ